MKLTKKTESEILKAYNAYWYNYLKGDVEAMRQLLDEKYTQVGSAETEVFSNRKDAVRFLYETIDQVAGKLEMRDREIILENLEHSILIHERCDVYVLADNHWIFYSKFRATTIMQKKKGRWKIIHQHSSFPDARTSDGENIATEKITKENLELKEAVKRRTIELEQKNRELVIETALEKVRTVAMAMRKSDDLLTVCKAMNTELIKLGFDNIRNSQIVINNDEKQLYVNYEYSDYNGESIADVPYSSHRLVKTMVNKMKKSRDAFFSVKIIGKELNEWRRFRSKLGQKKDNKLAKAKAVCYYFYSVGVGALGISTFETISKKQLELLQRFRNVFVLAYKRFTDIQNAEAQTREAQIEASLEKVRSQAMGMRRPDDMLEICRMISGQLAVLGITEIRNVQTAIFYENRGTYMNYEYYAKHDKTIITETTYTNNRIHKAFAIKMLKGRGQNFFTNIKGKKVKEWLAYQKTTNVFIDKYLNTASSLNYYWHSLGPVALGISTYFPLKKEELELFQRFLKVFELAYRRYLDIEKANAQAREAHIEVSLERIRAAAMAMRNSAELSSIIYKLYGELTKLDAKLDRCFIMIVNPDDKGITWWLAGKEGLLAENGFFIQPNQHPTHSMYLDHWKKRKKKWTYLFEGKEKRDWDHFGFSKTELAKLPDFIKEDMAAVKKIYLSGSSEQFGSLVTGSLEPLTDEHQEIISRFTIAFNQAYIRFLDMQKAEAQSREAQIQLALERVRARTMAMHKSEQLPETAQVLFEQFAELGNIPDRISIGIIKEELQVIEWWATDQMGSKLAIHFDASIHEPIIGQYFSAWKEGKENIVVDLSGKALKEWVDYVRDVVKMPIDDSKMKGRRVHHGAFFSKGILLISAHEPMPNETLQLLSRFAKVFSQTYTRFLDLQKAEAQAREAQIEAALERVRSRSMAMHTSDELKEVIVVVYRQLKRLAINLDHAGFVVDYTPLGDWHFWIADEQDIPSKISHPYFESVWATQFNAAKEKKEEFFTTRLNFEDKNKFYTELLSYIPGLPEASKEFYLTCPGLAVTTVILENVSLYIENFEGKPYTDDENKIIIRFGKVFEQTYTRFLDLQKAEAQAREAQIEFALERVRSRTMAMQKSDELAETAAIVFKQLIGLGVDKPNRLYIGIIKDESGDIEAWTTDEEGSKVNSMFKMNRDKNASVQKMYEGWSESKKSIIIDMQGKELTDYIHYLSNELHAPFTKGLTQSRRVQTISYFSKGFIGIASQNEQSESTIKLLDRFAAVFNLTYTRFLDLQKAETQAREAQIEASLERVRSRSMGMQKSEDLKDVIKVIYDQLIHLNFKLDNAGFFVDPRASNDYNAWDASADLPVMMHTPYFNHPINTDYLNHRDHGPELFTKSYSFEAKNSWWTELFKVIAGIPEEIKVAALEIRLQSPGLSISRVFMKNIGLYILNFSGTPYSDEDNAILLRFGKVFEQSYTRFNDLKQAEAQAREAQIEAALERVRSRTLAMQKSGELAGTAAVLFQQLISLGIEPNRLYIILVKENSSDMEAWLTDEDGSKVSKGFEGNYTKNSSLLKMYEGWKEKRTNLVIDMQGAVLQEYFHYLHDELKVPFKGGLEQKRRLQYIAYFSHGLIGMASPDEQPAETLQLLERFASVFNLTFTRFNDLKIAEAHALQAEQDLIAIKEAKQKAEAALNELQLTQKQLIQSEKMASLGELTAGIAHEIQNPLNFVNNFSEVSNELLQEMRVAMEKGDTNEAKEIMNDVIQNLEKINHHGKRADGIVKGMLQHSRTSSGQKELTDINGLFDEYLRLAYHGLKAKDKTFNAKFETDFDASIGKIEVMPQDIGRVILNLINNAFYAVSEKKKLNLENYEPTVSLITKKIDDNIMIEVQDNGSGIPQKIVDKIFQPFFTTKPTGQGTGLGLSLSYDIVTAHGGKMKVESEEGKGSTFIILLPTN